MNPLIKSNAVSGSESAAWNTVRSKAHCKGPRSPYLKHNLNSSLMKGDCFEEIRLHTSFLGKPFRRP